MHRRRVVVVLALILSFWSARPAPATGDGTIERRLADVFRDIPPGRIGGGILYDRVLPLSPIGEQIGAAGSRPIARREWLQIYSEMYRASLATPPWPEPSTLARRADPSGPGAVIPVAVVNLFYDRLRPDAPESGALSIRDSRVQPGAGDPFVRGRCSAPRRSRTTPMPEAR